jgi:hypothetical protein
MESKNMVHHPKYHIMRIGEKPWDMNFFNESGFIYVTLSFGIGDADFLEFSLVGFSAMINSCVLKVPRP